MASLTGGAPDALANFKFASWAVGAVPIAFVLHVLLFRTSGNNSGVLSLGYTVFLAAAAFLWLGVVSEIVPGPYLVSVGKIYSMHSTVCSLDIHKTRTKYFIFPRRRGTARANSWSGMTRLLRPQDCKFEARRHVIAYIKGAWRFYKGD
jgi:hypothetical protein